jgi:hypothetical protein
VFARNALFLKLPIIHPKIPLPACTQLARQSIDDNNLIFAAAVTGAFFVLMVA